MENFKSQNNLIESIDWEKPRKTYDQELADAYQYAELNVKSFLQDYTIKETEEVLRRNLLNDYVIKESEVEEIIQEVLYTPEVMAYADVMSTRN